MAPCRSGQALLPWTDANWLSFCQVAPESTEWYTALPSAIQRSPSALGLTAIELTHQPLGASAAVTEPWLSVKLWPPSVET